MLVAPDHQHAFVIDLVGTESCEKISAGIPVIEFVKPVDNLAVTVIESACPFPRCLFTLFLEDARDDCILEFNETVSASDPLSNRQVTRKVPEDVEFPCDSVGP